jgi:hypothetical protein
MTQQIDAIEEHVQCIPALAHESGGDTVMIFCPDPETGEFQCIVIPMRYAGFFGACLTHFADNPD